MYTKTHAHTHTQAYILGYTGRIINNNGAFYRNACILHTLGRSCLIKFGTNLQQCNVQPCNRSTCHTENWQRLIPFELLTKVAAAKKFQLSIKVRLSVRLLLSLSHSLCLSLSLQLSVSRALCPSKTIGQVCAFASLSNAI